MDRIIALIIFLFSYTLLITEKVNRTIVAILGATIMMIFGIFDNHIEAIKNYVDVNTIYLLMGMMIFVSVIRKKGLFEYLGIVTLKIFKKNGFLLYFGLTFMVALMSAIIDNVTTVLVFIPITLAITDSLDVDPLPFIFGEIMASNIGGTATIIGDPPNIMIASAAGLNFTEFFLTNGPISFINLFTMQIITMIMFKKTLNFKIDQEKVKSFDPHSAIGNKKDFIISWFLLILTLLMFIFQHQLEMESSTIALFIGFLALLILDKDEVEEILKEVEWGTILFFFGLFIITGGLVETGILKDFTYFLAKIAGDSMRSFAMMLIGVSGTVSGVVDNIPFTATMIPVIKNLQNINPETFGNLNPLWYALSLGACLGGNFTPIGASANIIALAMLKQFKNEEISFINFFKYAALIVSVNLIISAIYIEFILI
ncbi:citrate transporter [Marinitoga sp. 1135]|uniref:Na+/H+ antiporter NhaD-like permease n=1 Tax=Marinitoga piezophila (strain DSM 14283 / JCM 11233 / KA3) TaxID=443254 RepID=H2J2U0_MARPK|nr:MULTISPECIES: ArsB/NhaD family transporter [Marinitoga]AEX84534.1 Na+/H+ antiporter NhaD-like permease [Marinitoga piezophila KA3]NUU94779.1 citrate transporter [Marinitoga sp. 1135]NUU96708.1 citrate transporter [Marinitoga sp. 1138]